MTTPADRIRWLAELSAERRANNARLIRARAIGRTPEFRSKVGACSRKRRRATFIAQAQQGICYLCARPFGNDQPTLEHVTPKALMGRNRWNLLVAHQPCNLRKAHRQPYPCELMYLAFINERLRSTEIPVDPRSG